MTIRVILADDHPIFREGLVRTLEETGEFEVVGTGGSADEALDLVRRHRPDVALLDLSMPGGGVAAARAISALDPAPRIAVLTVSEEGGDVTDAMAAGAIGYLLKGVSANELRQTLAAIAGGQGFVSPHLASRLLAAMSAPQSARLARRPIDELTKREEDILRGVAEGLSNREIADRLSLQEKTVKHYMTGILGKLQARNRVEAALIAREAWGEGRAG